MSAPALAVFYLAVMHFSRMRFKAVDSVQDGLGNTAGHNVLPREANARRLNAMIGGGESHPRP